MSYEETENLSLKIPTLDNATGDEVVEYFNYNFACIESHDHTSGKGKKLRTSSLNITRDFTSSTYPFVNTSSVLFYSRETGLKLNSLYVKEKDFYINAQGTEIQLTFQGFFNSALLGGISGDYSTSPAFITYSLVDKGFFFYTDVGLYGNVSAGGILLYDTNATSPIKYIAIRAEDTTAQYEVFSTTDMPPSQPSFIVLDQDNRMGYYNLSEGFITTSGGTPLSTAQIKDVGSTFTAIQYSKEGVLGVSGSDAYILPKGTTAQRPTATDWMFRYNSDTSGIEVVIEGAWKSLTAVDPSTLTLQAVVETGITPPITAGKVLKYVGGSWVPSSLEAISWSGVVGAPTDLTTLSLYNASALSDVDTSVNENLQLLKFIGGVWKPMPDEGDSAAWGSVFGDVGNQTDLFDLITGKAGLDDILHEGTLNNFKLVRTQVPQTAGTHPLSNLTDFSVAPFSTDKTIGFTGGTVPSWGPTDAATGTPSPLTAKGDIWVGAQEGEAEVLQAALPVGENLQALFTDSTVPAGMKWGTSPSIDIKKGSIRGRVVSDIAEPSEGYFDLYSGLLSPAVLQVHVEAYGQGEGCVIIEDGREIQQVLSNGMNDIFMRVVESDLKYIPICNNLRSASYSEDLLCPAGAENPFSSKFVYSMATETAGLSSPANMFIVEKGDGTANLYVMTVQISTGQLVYIFRYNVTDLNRPLESISSPNFKLDISSLSIPKLNSYTQMYISDDEGKLIIEYKSSTTEVSLKLYDIDFTTLNMSATLPAGDTYTIIVDTSFRPTQVTDTFILGCNSSTGKVGMYTTIIPFNFASVTLTESSADIRSNTFQNSLQLFGVPEQMLVIGNKLHMGVCDVRPIAGSTVTVDDIYSEIESTVLTETFPYRTEHLFSQTLTYATATLQGDLDISLLTIQPVHRDQKVRLVCMKEGDESLSEVSRYNSFILFNDGKDMLINHSLSESKFKSLVHKKIGGANNLGTSYFKYPISEDRTASNVKGDTPASNAVFITPNLCIVCEKYEDNVSPKAYLFYTCSLSRAFDLSSKNKIIGWTVIYHDTYTPPNTPAANRHALNSPQNYKLFIADDGLSFVLAGYVSNFSTRVYTYTMTSPFDLGTATYTSVIDVAGPQGYAVMAFSGDLSKFAAPLYSDTLYRTDIRLYNLAGEVLGIIDPYQTDNTFSLYGYSVQHLFSYDKSTLYVVEDNGPYRVCKIDLTSFDDWSTPIYTIGSGMASTAYTISGGMLITGVMKTPYSGRWEPNGSTLPLPPCVVFNNEISFDNTIGFTVELDSVHI